MTIAGDRINIIHPDSEPMFSVETEEGRKCIPWGTVYRVDMNLNKDTIGILTATGLLKIKGDHLDHLCRFFARHEVESIDVSRSGDKWINPDPLSEWGEIYEIVFLAKSSKDRE